MRRHPKPEKIEQFEIRLDFGADSVEIDSTHGFVGVLPIRLVIGGRAYPTEEYADFAYAIVPMWLDDFTALLEEGRAELHFMDGPFALKAKRKGNSPYVTVKLDHELPDLQHFKVPIRVLARALFRAAKQLAETIEQTAGGTSRLRGMSDWNSLKENRKRAQTAWRDHKPPQHG